MNQGNINQTSVFNPCKCYHDQTRHVDTGLNTTSYCQDCTPGGNNHFHRFVGKWETRPLVFFQQSMPEGYFVAGGLGTYGPTSTIVGLRTVGDTLIPVISSAGAVPGGTLWVESTAAAKREFYRIVGVPDSTHVLIASPGLLFAYGNGETVSYQGEGASTMGPGLPPNGQRFG